MASVFQIKAQQATGAKYTGGELVLPEISPPMGDIKPVFIQGELKEGDDLGVVKVEDGKLVIDSDDFQADFGIYDMGGEFPSQL